MIGSFTPLDRLVQSEARVSVMHSEPRAQMPLIASATDWSNLMIASIDWALDDCTQASMLSGSQSIGRFAGCWCQTVVDALDRNC